MKISYKILLFVGGFFAVLILLVVVYASMSRPGGENGGTAQNQSQSLPEYILGDQEERELAEFVKYFVNLYNSYAYGYTSNLSALGDDQTTEMQQRTLELIEMLESGLPENFSQETEADAATFSYRYPEANHIIAFISAKVTEKTGSQVGVSPRMPAESVEYPVKVELDLIKADSKWYVNEIKITKNLSK